MEKMREVAIIGVGRTEFRRKGIFSADGGAAVEAAYMDVKGKGKILAKEDVEIAFFGCTTNIGNAGQMALQKADMLGMGCYNIDNGFVTGTQALYSAWRSVASGQHDVAIAFGAGTMKSGGISISPGGQEWWHYKKDNPSPYIRLYAQLARRYMKEYNVTKEQLAAVSVKNHKNGMLNPNAMIKEEVTIDSVLNSKMEADPLTKYMCAPTTSGGACLILAPAKQGKYYSKVPIRIKGCAITSGKAGLGFLDSAYDAFIRAKQQACIQVSPWFSSNDIDVAQVHDAFSITELICYEALGLCKRGEGAKLLESGATSLDGNIPINTDGGFMSNGYCLGASDIAQIVENVLQLRGDAGDRQIKKENMKYALSMIGGSGGTGFCGGIAGRGFGVGGGYAVTILEKY